jgi:hypothetical protein
MKRDAPRDRWWGASSTQPPTSTPQLPIWQRRGVEVLTTPPPPLPPRQVTVHLLPWEQPPGLTDDQMTLIYLVCGWTR